MFCVDCAFLSHITYSTKKNKYRSTEKGRPLLRNLTFAHWRKRKFFSLYAVSQRLLQMHTRPYSNIAGT